MIKKIIEKIFNTQEEIKEEELECAVDEEVVDCEGEAFVQDALNYYTGIPAPAYLPDDEWFGPTPNLTEKQKDYMAVEMEWKIEEEKKRKESGVEPDDIHQKMYEIATSNWNTVAETQGGSENFQGGSENVHG
jgi:hypothetical protein